MEREKVQEKPFLSVIKPPPLEESQILLDRIREALNRPKEYEIYVLTANAGAGHWRQAERLMRFLRGLMSEEQINNIHFLAVDLTEGKITNLADLVGKFYPELQRRFPWLISLFHPLLNTQFGRRIIDSQLRNNEKIKEEVKRLIREPEEQNNDNGDEEKKRKRKKRIFLSTHVSIAAVLDLEEGDWLIEFVPDPWTDSDLRAMTAPNIKGNHIVVVHDEETAREYMKERIKDGSSSPLAILPWGTISNERFLRERLEGETLERESVSDRIDIFIECSGNEIPKFDEKVIAFLNANAEKIKEGKIRIVIDPMRHRNSYNKFTEALSKLGLAKSSNVLLLETLSDLDSVVKRREDIIEGKNDQVKREIPDFNPIAVIAKGGEVPLEDRGKIVVLCPLASVPHEIRDIETGVRERRAIDLRNVDPAQWIDKFKEFIKSRENEPPPSYALYAIGLVGLENIISKFSTPFEIIDNTQDKEDIFNFIFPDILSLKNQEQPMSILSRVFSLLRDIYGEERRKVNGGLYLRHILKAGFLAVRLYEQYQESFLQGINFDRFFISALLHDAFEINPSMKENLFSRLKEIFFDKDDSWVSQVVEDVQSLTPPEKDPRLSYLERKKQDFERFVPKKEDGNDKPFESWSVDEKIRFFIKTADVWANLYESVDDLRRGLDNGQMQKSLSERYQVFSYRVERILKILGEQNLPELASLKKDFSSFYIKSAEGQSRTDI